jgi:hypothetical protein
MLLFKLGSNATSSEAYNHTYTMIVSIERLNHGLLIVHLASYSHRALPVPSWLLSYSRKMLNVDVAAATNSILDHQFFHRSAVAVSQF